MLMEKAKLKYKHIKEVNKMFKKVTLIGRKKAKSRFFFLFYVNGTQNCFCKLMNLSKKKKEKGIMQCIFAINVNM